MIDIATPVDAELVVIEYLRPTLAAIAPDAKIDVRGGGGHFVRVRRVGGIAPSPAHDQPMLDVMIWHDSDMQRMRLALELWRVLRAAAGDVASGGVIFYIGTTLGPRQMPDPADDTKTVCMFTVELLTRPVAA
jgi:hypothetical protein